MDERGELGKAIEAAGKSKPAKAASRGEPRTGFQVPGERIRLDHQGSEKGIAGERGEGLLGREGIEREGGRLFEEVDTAQGEMSGETGLTELHMALFVPRDGSWVTVRGFAGLSEHRRSKAEMGDARTDNRRALEELDGDDVIGDDGHALPGEAVGGGGLACAGGAQKDGGAAAGVDRASMQYEEPSLMQEDRHGWPQ